MKKLSTIFIALLTTFSYSLSAEENTPNINSYTMGAVVGEQLLNKIETTENLGHDIDKYELLTGLIDSLSGKIEVTKKDKELIISNVKQQRPENESHFNKNDIKVMKLKEGNGHKPELNSKVKLKYVAYLENGEKFSTDIKTIDLEKTFSRWSEIFVDLEEQGLYQLEVPHFLKDTKNQVLSDVLISWINDEKLLPEDSVFKQNIIPHQLAYRNDAEVEMKPYSSMIFQIEIVEII